MENTSERLLSAKLAQLEKELAEKNRELEIEAALERVRARTMAMQHQNDLLGVTDLFDEQLICLGFDLEIVNFGNGLSYGDWDLWLTSPTGETTRSTNHMVVPWIDHPYFEKTRIGLDNFKKGIDLNVAVFNKAEKDSFLDHLFANTILKDLPEESRAYLYSKPGFTFSTFFLKETWVSICKYDTKPFTDVQHAILRRFAHAFGQAYTRFLDLKKAEEQAREAQIEVALERVRGSAMAMHNSNDISDTTTIAFTELQKLGIQSIRCGIGLLSKDSSMASVYAATTSSDGEFHTLRRIIDMTEHSSLAQQYETWLKQENYQTVLSGEELKSYYNLPFFHSSPTYIPPEHYDQKEYGYYISFSEGLFYAWTEKPYSEDEQNILNRFKTIIDLTFRRYLDLKKAEAQAREAQIEAMLERVRSRAMAMQKSDELTDVASLLFEQVSALGIKTWTAGFNVWSEDNNSYVDYITSPQGGFIEPYTVYTETAEALTDISNARKSGVEFDVQYVEGEKIKQLYLALTKLDEKMYEVMLQDGVRFPSHQYEHFVFGSKVSLMFITYEPVPEAHDIFKRLGKVFEQAYTRFLDLQKAEAQARESQIQLALERVRARTMAMQKSDELSEAVYVLFQQFKELGEQPDQATIGIICEAEKVIEYWVTMYGNPINKVFKFSIDEPNVTNRIYKAWKENKKSLVIDLSGKALSEFMAYRAGKGGAAVNLNEKRRIINVAFFSKGLLNVQSNKERSEESIKLLERFAAVFEQTYTRFLDLQKSEAQARESQIETSLEKVRSKTMAMHNSNDVGETVATMFAEFVHLGIHTNRCGILIFNDPNVAEVWTARSTPGGSAKLIIGKLDLDAHKLLRYGYNAWKAKETFYQYDLIDDDLKNYYNAINNSKFYPTLFDLNALPVKEFCSDFLFTDGLVFSFTNEPVAEEYAKIIKRFALVFGQTYRRYLDLQKAEVQAREAQIETSLERVRSKTMAMHSSDDVTSATATMFTELDRLGIENMRCGIAHYQEDHKMEVWSVSNLADGKVVKGAGLLDTNSLPFWKIFYSTWQKKEDFLYYLMAGKEKEDYFKKISTLENYLSRSIEDVPDLSIQTYYFPEGSVWAFSLKPHSEEDKQVMKRFASVFSLTFRRYQDLQKAEAQVREARIEAALERVRARTMAMQRSDELREAATLLFQQVQLLEIPVWTCGYNIWETGEESCTGWMSTRGAIQPSFSIPLTESPVFIRMNESRLRGEPFFTEEVSGEALADHYRYLFSLSDFKKIATKQLEDGFTLPSSQVHNIFNFKHGNVIFISAKPVPESWDIFKRFTAVFEQTYIRFNDLKQAEERAREAVKHASVDRVRAEIASMRTTNDLERITPLIWNELTTLGVPFIRCGVFIMDEEQQQVHTFLSTPEGEAIAAFHLPYSAPGETAAILAHWHKKEMYKQHWNEDQFIGFTKNLVQQGAITTGEKYLTENRPTNLYLHFLPFLQGMLYAGNTAPLSDDALQLMQELADAFSTAYARYEDFNKLELAKEQIEKTLVDLKQAQAQLVQSEKMASLGELTAGIAHEIQNPLNFVNNFSEVNTELIEELKGERSKVKGERDEKLEDQLLSDLLENEQKIIHHGKRADAIVKNMLQHSRTSKGVKELTDINALCDEYLRLSFHGLRAKDKSFNTDFKTDFDNSIGRINIIPQDLGRVLLNLVNNAFYAVNEKLKAHGSQLTADYKPLVSVQTKKIEDKVEIIVRDNGNGIPQNIVDKIFQPFFTTKPTGEGTGLGLSLSYDIIKTHGGEIKVETKEGEGSEFVIQLSNI